MSKKAGKKAGKKTGKTGQDKPDTQAGAGATADPARIDDLIKELKTKDELLNVRKTLLKKEEWGLLTILNLLLASIFPAYFVNILMISFFTELGHLWTTHLTEVGRRKLIEFEKEFRVGYDMEKEGRIKEAIEVYGALIPKYKGQPKISGIAVQRIEYLKKKGA
jgi:hypothetical protein